MDKPRQMQLLSRALSAQLEENCSVISESSSLYEHVDTLSTQNFSSMLWLSNCKRSSTLRIVYVIIFSHWMDNLYKNSNNILSSYLLSFVSFQLNLFSFFFWFFFRFANLEWSVLCIIFFLIIFFILIILSCMTYIDCVQLALASFHEVLTLPFTQLKASRQFVFTNIYGHYT